MTKEQKLAELTARLEELSNNPPKTKTTSRPVQKKKQMNSLVMGVLVILGIVATIVAGFAIMISLPFVIIILFYIVKFAVIVGLFIGVVWAIGMGANKLRRTN